MKSAHVTQSFLRLRVWLGGNLEMTHTPRVSHLRIWKDKLKGPLSMVGAHGGQGEVGGCKACL